MRERAIGMFPIIEVVPRIDVLTQGFCVRTFSIRRMMMEFKRWRRLFWVNEYSVNDVKGERI